MRLEISAPRRRILACSDHPDPHEGEEGKKHTLRMLEHIRIARDRAKLQVKSKIGVEQLLTWTFDCRAAHDVHGLLQAGCVGLLVRRQPRREPFERSSKLIELENIDFPKTDHACASTRLL